ncbi:hypothetical protein ACJ41O_005806 [Fusarium nematophilum]
MRNKRRVVIALYHRDRFSLGDNRTRLGYEAYHWGIIIMPKHPINGRHLDCNAYDATDIAVIDPKTRRDLNPNLDWFFRPQHHIDPSATGRLIGRIIVGKLPKHISDSTVDALLAEVPLPTKNASPPQSCVTWALGALSVLQASGLAWSFDVGQFQDWALAYGDQCMASPSPDNVCGIGANGLREGTDCRSHKERCQGGTHTSACGHIYIFLKAKESQGRWCWRDPASEVDDLCVARRELGRPNRPGLWSMQ